MIAIRPRPGLGALTGGAATAAQIAETGAATTGLIIGALAAIPVAGPIAAGIAALGVAIANAFSGCGQTCVEATAIANQVGDTLTQNLEQYMSAPVHYASLQAAALNNFTTAWNALQAGCSNPALGSAGKACISDRQQGACTWKASPGGWTQGTDGTWTYAPWGPAGSGTACWNWFIGLHDPIANDPTVVPDPSGVSSIASSISSGSLFGVPLSLLLPAGALLLAAWLID
jgi:hypothetical protein